MKIAQASKGPTKLSRISQSSIPASLKFTPKTYSFADCVNIAHKKNQLIDWKRPETEDLTKVILQRNLWMRLQHTYQLIPTRKKAQASKGPIKLSRISQNTIPRSQKLPPKKAKSFADCVYIAHEKNQLIDWKRPETQALTKFTLQRNFWKKMQDTQKQTPEDKEYDLFKTVVSDPSSDTDVSSGSELLLIPSKSS